MIDEPIEILKNYCENFRYAQKSMDKSLREIYGDTVGDEEVSAIETLLTAYEKEKEKNKSLIKERATEIVYVDKNFVRKDKIKPIQIIDLDGKIHNVYKIEVE